MISFTNTPGRTVDIGVVALNFHKVTIDSFDDIRNAAEHFHI